VAKPETSHFSLENSRKLLKKAQTLQNLIKIQALISDSLSKINSLLSKIEGKKETVLLTQVANNLLKAQTQLQMSERHIEKTLPENSNHGNF